MAEGEQGKDEEGCRRGDTSEFRMRLKGRGRRQELRSMLEV